MNGEEKISAFLALPFLSPFFTIPQTANSHENVIALSSSSSSTGGGCGAGGAVAFLSDSLILV